MSFRPFPLLLLLALSLSPACLAGQAVPAAYTLAADRSTIYVVTYRSGLLSFLGHDHAILATDWSGDLCWTPEAPLAGRGRITVATAGLVIDTDQARATAGLGGGPSAGQMRTVQAKLMDHEHLDAPGHPQIILDVRRVVQAREGNLDIEGQLTIRDRVRDVRFPVVIETAQDGVRVRGRLRIAQRDFGIRPESIAGVVKVANEVDIHFDLAGTPTGILCQ